MTTRESAAEYSAARPCLVASKAEPFGLVPLESMACGTPVVAVDDGGLRESIENGGTGLLVERNPASFAQAACSLLEAPAARARFGLYARENVLQHWTWARSVEDLCRHFVEVTGHSSSRHGSDARA